MKWVERSVRWKVEIEVEIEEGSKSKGVGRCARVKRGGKRGRNAEKKRLEGQK